MIPTYDEVVADNRALRKAVNRLQSELLAALAEVPNSEITTIRARADKPCCRCAKLVWGVTDPDAQVVCEECRKTKAPERTEMERAVLEPYLPEGYDYEDDCSVELAVQLAERDQENAVLRKAVSKLQGELLRIRDRISAALVAEGDE